mmetsp:Transcript_23889/g.44905  ORF Transcript_23889/g.44905 Transcript_23889/m.44905 type:complete len:247 (+) Transcript_23889:570-1310(+)
MDFASADPHRPVILVVAEPFGPKLENLPLFLPLEFLAFLHELPLLDLGRLLLGPSEHLPHLLGHGQTAPDRLHTLLGTRDDLLHILTPQTGQHGAANSAAPELLVTYHLPYVDFVIFAIVTIAIITPHVFHVAREAPPQTDVVHDLGRTLNIELVVVTDFRDALRQFHNHRVKRFARVHSRLRGYKVVGRDGANVQGCRHAAARLDAVDAARQGSLGRIYVLLLHDHGANALQTSPDRLDVLVQLK